MKTLCSPVLLMLMFTTTPNIDVTCCNFHVPFSNPLPQDAHHMLGGGNNEFDQTSSLFLANTQLNIIFTRRPATNLLNYMLPTNLNLNLGAANENLTVDQRATALNFSVTAPAVGDADPVVTQYNITGIAVNIQNMYLQVSAQDDDDDQR